MIDQKISEKGRKERYAQWERLGVERVKQDLLSGGYKLVGGPPEVQELAWEWVQEQEKRDPGIQVRELIAPLPLQQLTEETSALDTHELLEALGLTPSTTSMLRDLGLMSDANLSPPKRKEELSSIAAASKPDANLSPPLRKEEPLPIATASTPQENQGELLILRPTFWGVGIDLKEAGRRLRRFLKRWG